MKLRGRRSRRWVVAVALVMLFGVLVAASAGKNAQPVSLFIFAGQSNMAGAGSVGATLPAALRTPRPDAQFWDATRRAWSTTPLTDGGRFGPEVAATRRLADRLEGPVLAVKVAVDATSLAEHWDPSRGDGMYAVMSNAVSDALLARPAGEARPVIAGFFWMQGETDARDIVTASAYAVNLRRLVSQVRWDYSTDRLPVVLGRIRAEDPDAPPDGLALVRSATDGVGRGTPNVRAVSTDDLRLVDGLHFDGPALIRLGTAFADAYLTLERPR